MVLFILVKHVTIAGKMAMAGVYDMLGCLGLKESLGVLSAECGLVSNPIYTIYINYF